MAEDEGRKDEDVTGDDDEEEEEKPWTPPTKEEWERLQKTAATRKTERQEVQRQLTELKEAAKNKDAATDTGQAKELEGWKKRALTSAASVALSQAGFSGDKGAASRLTKLLDLDQAQPDKSGEYDFSDEVEDLKKEFPALFAKPDETGPRRKPSTTDRGGRNTTGVNKTSDRLMKQAGY